MTCLTLDVANAILAGAIREARRLNLSPLTVVVVDESGNLKAAAREDGASMFRFDIALGKAYGAAGMGLSSRKLGEASAKNPNFFVSLAATANGKFLPQTGAVLIKSAEGAVIGAVGASGAHGDEDEAACYAGLAAAGLPVEPA